MKVRFRGRESYMGGGVGLMLSFPDHIRPVDVDRSVHVGSEPACKYFTLIHDDLLCIFYSVKQARFSLAPLRLSQGEEVKRLGNALTPSSQRQQ